MLASASTNFQYSMMITTNESISSDSTPARLLDGAERCVFLHGYGGTSIRRIAQEAGTDIASINYHFGSKQALFAALIRRRLNAVTQRRDELLQSIERGEGYSSDDIANAYFGALFQVRQNVGREIMVVIWTLLIGDPEASRSSDRPVDDTFIKVRQRYAQLLSFVTPGVPVAEFEYRLEILERFVLCVMVGPEICLTLGSKDFHDTAAINAHDFLSEGLVSIIRACIQAPVAIDDGHHQSCDRASNSEG